MNTQSKTTPDPKKIAHGHTYTKTVDHGVERMDRIDLRVNRRNRDKRTNVRARDGRRSKFFGTFMEGTEYADLRQCSSCERTLSRTKFRNYAVAEKDRAKNGCNIRCRDCQPIQYSCGYRCDDFVSDEIEYW